MKSIDPETAERVELRPATWVALGAAWLAWGLVNAARLHGAVGLDWPTALWYGLPDAAIWAGYTPLVVRLVRRLPLRGVGGFARHLAIAAGLALLHTAIDTWISLLRPGSSSPVEDYARIYFQILQHTLHLNLLVYLVVAGLAQYRLFVVRLRERERREAELRARLSEARLRALRAQLQPHFLFNALHTISGLMGRDPETGRRVVSRLGDLLRRSLDEGAQGTVPLAREIEFARAYLEVEQARFGDRLRTSIDVDASLAARPVPAFLLQPLVENAVVHGIARRTAGGTIAIHARDAGDGALELRVEDDGPGPGSEGGDAETEADVEARAGGGLGLENVRRRLAELYGTRARVEVVRRDGGGTRVLLRLPAPAEVAA